MKNFITSGLGVLVLILLGYIFISRQCSKSTNCPPKGYVLVSQATWDSIQTLANKPPAIKRDTVYIKGKIIYVNSPLPIAKPKTEDSTINSYSDSIVNKQINVHYNFDIKGKLLCREWSYIPITTQITIEKTIYVPKIVNNPVPTSKAGLFISALVGGNKETFLFGGNLDLITKKNTMIGVVYQRWGNDNLYSVKLGIPIKFK
jgi:hypothetical protein